MNSRLKKTFPILGLFFLLTFVSGAAAQVGGIWQTLAPMPTARQELATPRAGIAVAAVNGELFVFGGETFDPNGGGGEVHGEVEVFNPATNTWRSLSPMPTPRHGIWASVIGNQIFLPGGGIVSGIGATNVNEVFIVSP